MSVEVDIYMNNIVKFFKENPKDLLNLVPKDKEDEFYDKIRKVAHNNYEKVEEAPLTQKQLIDVCVEINGKDPNKKPKLNDITFDTKFGKIFLN
jgi:nitrogenase subunit NifH